MNLSALFYCNLDYSENTLLDISDSLLISKLDCVLVKLPLFGRTNILGCTLMKRSKDYCFNITKKQVKR